MTDEFFPNAGVEGHAPFFFVNAYQGLPRSYSTINWPVIFLWPNPQNTEH